MLLRAKQFFEIMSSIYRPIQMGVGPVWWANLTTVLFRALMLILPTVLLLPSVILTSRGKLGRFVCR